MSTHRELSFAERLSSLREKGFMCDVKFVIGESKAVFHAHKLILAVKSGIFREGLTPYVSPEIVLPCFKEPAFEKFLRFMYSDELDMLDSVLEGFDILEIASFYYVDALKRQLRERILRKLRDDNVLTILQKGKNALCNIICDSAMNYIDRNFNWISQTDSFLEASDQVLISILGRNTIRAEEHEIFLSLARWAKHSLGRQNLDQNCENFLATLKDLLPLSRFPQPHLSDFIEIFTCGATSETVEFVIGQAAARMPVSRYVGIPRPWSSNTPEYLSLFRESEIYQESIQPDDYYHAIEYWRFRTNRRVFIRGVVVNGVRTSRRNMNYFYRITISKRRPGELFKDDLESYIALITHRAKTSNCSLNNPAHVLFQKGPIEILPDCFYVLTAEFQIITDEDSYDPISPSPEDDQIEFRSGRNPLGICSLIFKDGYDVEFEFENQPADIGNGLVAKLIF